MVTCKKDSTSIRTAALILIGITACLNSAFQTIQILRERSVLDQVFEDQADRLRAIGEERAIVEALTNRLLSLADQGDKQAQEIVTRMNLERFRGASF